MPATVSLMRASPARPRPEPVRAPLDPALLSELLGALYDGALERPPWRDALALLQRSLDAAHIVLVLRPPTPENEGVMISPGEEDLEARRSYEQHFFAVDPFVGLKEGEVVTAEELIGPAWLDSPIYRNYLKPLDVRHLLGTDIYTEEGIECRLRATRGHGGRPFDDHDKALLRFLLPHLTRAIRLHARMDSLECERQVFAGTVNRLLVGMVCLSASGEIVEMNDEARRILDERDGLRLGLSGLTAQGHEENRELQRLIRHGLQPPVVNPKPGLVQAMPVSRLSGRSPYVVLIKPVPATAWSENPRRPATVVYLRDPEANPSPPSIELVRRLFGLTRVESRLALLLTNGLTLDEAADQMGIRRNTARTHLRSIFGKTGVTRQTLLVRLLLRSVFALA
jgi:DNA-binding CsgD family transcriptional regulator